MPVQAEPLQTHVSPSGVPVPPVIGVALPPKRTVWPSWGSQMKEASVRAGGSEVIAGWLQVVPFHTQVSARMVSVDPPAGSERTAAVAPAWSPVGLVPASVVVGADRVSLPDTEPVLPAVVGAASAALFGARVGGA